MAQPPPDQNFYHHTLPHPHPHQHPHSQHAQLPLPPQFRNPFDLLYDDRTGSLNYNYIRPYLPNQMSKPDDLADSLVMRRPRRTRTTFTSSQIAELEQHFLQGRYLTAPRLADLSAKLALGTAQVKIWFKNRRRRHKIQSDQHKDQSYDGMPISPTMPNAPQKGADADPPSLQALNLGGGGGATPNALTPSPTPSTPTAHLAEHYGEPFNAYYNYNNHHTQANGQQRHMSQYPSSTTTNAAAQFFPAGPMQQHGNPHAQQQLHQQAAPPPSHHQQSQQLAHHHVMAQQQQQQQYHHFDFQQKRENVCRVPQLKDENESDFNFSGSYYMRTTPLPPAGVVSGTAAVEAVTSALSPGSEVYEPLTPKNDESPSLCGGGPGGGVGVGAPCTIAIGADDMDDESNKKTTSLQNLLSLKSNNVATNKSCGNGSNALGTGLLAMARGNFSCGNNSNSVFSKFGKLMPSTQATSNLGSSVNSMHDANQFQCTMDTIMHAYNPHRNAGGNTQFAFCFN